MTENPAIDLKGRPWATYAVTACIDVVALSCLVVKCMRHDRPGFVFHIQRMDQQDARQKRDITTGQTEK